MLAGAPETAPDGTETVRFRRAFRITERRVLIGLVTVDALAHVGFLAWLVAPSHWISTLSGKSAAAAVLGAACFAAVIVVELIRTIQASSLWVFSWSARDPIPMPEPAGLRIAALTTIVPSVEPLEMVAETLAAMREMRYESGAVDVWILDEGDDPAVRSVAAALGVHHFSRRGKKEFNTVSGMYRARTKAGNHNAWFSCHGDAYDVVAQLDPDHVPGPHFLERTLGYFRDPDVAFVVAPQVYGNIATNLPAHGAAAQAYLFHGVIQRGGNGLGAPLLIGTNHVYRAATWQQIGGYQDCIIEDHLTSMTVHASLNPSTGHAWKGVYTPDVLAVGQAPETWGDLFVQQRRWAQGAAEIALRHSRRLLPHMTRRQQLTYVLLQSFYPAVALTWGLGTLVTVALLVGAGPFGPAESVVWAALWAASVLTTLVLFLWLRRVNLARHERRESGIHGMLTTLCSAPVYTAAVISALLRKPLGYHVTPKGGGSSEESFDSFAQHLRWFLFVAIAMLTGASGVGDRAIAWAWAGVTLAVCAIPPLAFVLRTIRG